MPEQSKLKTTLPHLLIPILGILVFIILCLFRHLDNNRLTSWNWVFSDLNMLLFIPILVVGIFIIFKVFSLPFARQRPGLFLFLISFAVCSVFWKVPEVIIDASRYFTQAKHLKLYGVQYFNSEWGNGIHAWTDLPLVPFLYGIVFNLFGESRAFIQVLTTLFFSCTVVLTYLTGKSLWDESTGLFAGALLLGIPYIYSQVPLMLVDIPTMFFLTLACFTCIMAIKKGGVWIVCSSLAIFCAIFSKYSTWMMLSVLVIIFVVFMVQGEQPGSEVRQGRRTVVLRGLITVLCAALLAGTVALLKLDVITGQISFLREYQVPGLRRWGESFISTFLYQVHPFITIASLYALYRALKEKDLRFLIVSWLILLIVVFQIQRSRYVLVTFPMLALMASYGLQAINSPDIKKHILSCAVGTSLVIAMYGYLPFMQTMSLGNLQAAAEYMDSHESEGIAIFTVQSEDTSVSQAVTVPIFDLFTDKEIRHYYDDSYSLSREEIDTSPLRFTWEYRAPRYYSGEFSAGSAKPAAAVISNGPIKKLPPWIEEKLEGYSKIKEFYGSTGIFKFSPGIALYSIHQSVEP